MTRPLCRDSAIHVALPIVAIIACIALGAWAQVSGSGKRGGSPMDGSPLLFLPAVTYRTGGLEPVSVAIGDVNGDGIPDLVVANESKEGNSNGSVGVLLGNGDGTFQKDVAYRSGGWPARSVAIGDVNGDGKPDLVVVSECADQGHCTTEDGVVGVLLGNGDGTFKPVVKYDSGGDAPSSVAIADVNGDGRPDVLVVNYCQSINNCNNGTVNGTVEVLLNSGTGGFQRSSYELGGPYGTSVVVADVNGDGKPDLLATNACGDRSCVSVLLGNGDGTFQAAQVYDAGGSTATGLAVADLNGDGKPDLAVANLGTGVGILVGNGDGTFQPAVDYDAGGIHAVAVTDVNGDGKPDLAVATESGVGLLLGNGDGTFQPVQLYGSGGIYSLAIAVGDLNGDSKPDVAAVNEETETVAVLLNNSGAPPTTTSLASNVNPTGSNRKVTYTATVVSQSGGTLTGTVTFVDHDALGATLTLVNNQASYAKAYSKKEIGVHLITAVYSGVLHKAAGSESATLTEYVPGSSQTTLSTSGSPSQAGQAVTFTARVTSQYGTIPDGEMVTFYDGKTVLGSMALAGAQAAYTTSSLLPKEHIVTATYAGDNSFEPSTGKVKQVVEK
jgi:hypothetical protein